jgi:hypothetical protein
MLEALLIALPLGNFMWRQLNVSQLTRGVEDVLVAQ